MTVSPSYVKRAKQMFLRGFVAAQRAASPSDASTKVAMEKTASAAAHLNDQVENRILGIFALSDTIRGAKQA